jgi:rhodanese-related sulfurtransferase
MEHLPEFISNHVFLCGGLVAVLSMLVMAELDHQTGKAFQLSSVNAIRMMNGDETILFDVREAAEYNRGHIKKATNVPLSSLKEKLNDFMQHKDKPVLVYCANGTASGRACKMFKNAGFSNVHNLEGGLSGWQEAKLPVTTKA